MKLRLRSAGSATIHYALAYLVALPIFVLSKLVRRVVRRGESGQNEP